MSQLTRRQVLTVAGAAAASAILPRRVLARQSPNEKLNIAGIGVGGQGAANLANLESENIVALCDVDWERAGKTFEKYPDAKRYKDFRDMLEKEKSIDAVVIATPDHVHAVAAIMAMKLGKHVYVEKPLAHSVYETRRMCEVARETRVATQMGNHGHASESMRLLKEWISAGAIGAVREVQAWTTHAVWPQGLHRPKDTPPTPETLDWDLWLGPAPQRPYHPAYVPMLWRGWWDFGTGAIGDMGCHVLDPVFYALEATPPDSVEASCSLPVPEGLSWDKQLNLESYPQASVIRFRFPARDRRPAFKLTWYDGGLLPERPEELEPDRKMGSMFGGILFIGDKGKIMANAHGAEGVRIIPESRMQSFVRPDKSLPRSPGHHAEWIAACKGGPRAGSNFDYAGPLTETSLLGNVALRAQQRIEWDSAKLEVTNLPSANAFLKREYRPGWSV